MGYDKDQKCKPYPNSPSETPETRLPPVTISRDANAVASVVGMCLLGGLVITALGALASAGKGVSECEKAAVHPLPSSTSLALGKPIERLRHPAGKPLPTTVDGHSDHSVREGPSFRFIIAMGMLAIALLLAALLVELAIRPTGRAQTREHGRSGVVLRPDGF